MPFSYNIMKNLLCKCTNCASPIKVDGVKRLHVHEISLAEVGSYVLMLLDKSMASCSAACNKSRRAPHRKLVALDREKCNCTLGHAMRHSPPLSQSASIPPIHGPDLSG